MKSLKTTPILDGAYETVGVIPGPCRSVFGEVDLSRLTVEMADKLIAVNFPYLRKVTPKQDKKSGKAKRKE